MVGGEAGYAIKRVEGREKGPNSKPDQHGGTRECRTWWPVPEAKDANGLNSLITVLRNIR